MKLYNFLILFGIFFSWSCSSGQQTSDENTKTNEKKTEEDSVIVVDFQSFVNKFPNQSLPYILSPSGDNAKYTKIPFNEQVAYLLEAENTSEQELKNMNDNMEFFYVSNLLNTKNYHILIYGKTDILASPHFQYVLCTYNKDGKLISHINFASYIMTPGGPTAGEICTEIGKIDKNKIVSVTLLSDHHSNTILSETRYKIKDNGKIVPLK